MSEKPTSTQSKIKLQMVSQKENDNYFMNNYKKEQSYVQTEANFNSNEPRQPLDLTSFRDGFKLFPNHRKTKTSFFTDRNIASNPSINSPFKKQQIKKVIASKMKLTKPKQENTMPKNYPKIILENNDNSMKTNIYLLTEKNENTDKNNAFISRVVVRKEADVLKRNNTKSELGDNKVNNYYVQHGLYNNYYNVNNNLENKNSNNNSSKGLNNNKTENTRRNKQMKIYIDKNLVNVSSNFTSFEKYPIIKNSNENSEKDANIFNKKNANIKTESNTEKIIKNISKIPNRIYLSMDKKIKPNANKFSEYTNYNGNFQHQSSISSLTDNFPISKGGYETNISTVNTLNKKKDFDDLINNQNFECPEEMHFFFARMILAARSGNKKF